MGSVIVARGRGMADIALGIVVKARDDILEDIQDTLRNDSDRVWIPGGQGGCPGKTHNPVL